MTTAKKHVEKVDKKVFDDEFDSRGETRFGKGKLGNLFHMLHSRLKMFNMESLAVEPLQQFDPRGKRCEIGR
jgi:hypothetical protein